MQNGARQLPMVDHALSYASLGYRVFPLHTACDGKCTCSQREECKSAGKHPRIARGVLNATADVEQIRRWWSEWEWANIGIATGNGLYVIDIDVAKGGSLSALRDCNLAAMTHSFMVRTGSGGYHIYLRYDPELWLPNTASKLAPFIDTRGDGGYVVAPPSWNKDGKYVYEQVGSVWQMPQELLDRLKALGCVFFTANVKHERSQQYVPDKMYEKIPENDHRRTPVSTTGVTQNAPTTADDNREPRNEHLARMAGKLVRDGIEVALVREMLIIYNNVRFGHGRHVDGPLELDELKRTVFQSLEKWQVSPTSELGTLSVQSLSSLLESDLPDTAWIVPELLPEGLTILAGKPKAGKSWLILSLALGVACGMSVLGKEARPPQRVLHLSLEDSQQRLQKRVRQLLNGQPLQANYDYKLEWRNLSASGLEDLCEYLDAKPDTKLVIIDTLARVRKPLSGTGMYQEDYQLMGQLQSIATRYHIALIVVHHLRKMASEDTFDEISGSTGLTGAADTSMVLKRERNQTGGTLHITGRDIEEQGLALTFQPSSGLWSLDGTIADQQASNSKQQVLDLLADSGSMTPKDIAKALEIPGGTLRMQLIRMVQEGVLKKESRGHYSLPDADVIPDTFADEASNNHLLDNAS